MSEQDPLAALLEPTNEQRRKARGIALDHSDRIATHWETAGKAIWGARNVHREARRQLIDQQNRRWDEMLNDFYAELAEAFLLGVPSAIIAAIEEIVGNLTNLYARTELTVSNEALMAAQAQHYLELATLVQIANCTAWPKISGDDLS